MLWSIPVGGSFKNLYIHFPYCETKCHYCDFFSLPEAKTPKTERIRAYTAMESELSLMREALASQIETVFLGGGTPSLAPTEVITRLLDVLPLDAASEV